MAYRGPVYSRPRRRSRLRPVAVAVLVVLLVGGGIYGVRQVQDARRAARVRSLAEATATAHGFLAAWGRGDTASMAAEATPDSAALVHQLIDPERQQLQIVSATYTPGPVHTDSRTAPPGTSFHATVVLRGLATWRYDSRLVLAKVAGHWKVAFSSETVHPQLHAGDQLVRSRALGRRGRIVLADGVSLRGADGELDGNMLGAVGKYTAAQAAAAGPRYLAGDVGGLTGLERGYNQVLSGTPGGSLKITNADGRVLATLISQPITNGKNVVVSFDLGVQHAAEHALAGLGPEQTGSLVAIDVASGKVLAVANHPYNGYGRAIRGRYPPGSTFKVITTTAALDSGVSPDVLLPCAATATVDGRVFHNAEHEVLGTINLRTAFAQSCNTAYVTLASRLPAGALGKAAALFGFSPQPEPGPLPLTSFGGSVPPPVDGADQAAEAIGQGRDVASPLQMASVAAAIAAGSWRSPYVSNTMPAGNPSHRLPAAVVATLQEFTAQVVADGTAAHAGLPAGTHGKTGTAEIGSASPPATVAWFIGYRDGIAFACQVGGDGRSGGFGADTAAPTVARFLAAVG